MAVTSIEKMRTEANISQNQLAKLSGVKQSVISDIENKKTKSPRIDTLMRIASVFGCNVEELLREA